VSGTHALVLFMRGVNVGGNKVFQPSLLAKELSHLGVLNIGAAGTFIITGQCSQATLRAEILNRLAFPAELMICRGSDIVDLVARNPFLGETVPGDVRRFASVLARSPRTYSPLPHGIPAGKEWQVRFIDVSGRFALALWRRLGRSPLDPNGVAEKHFGMTATTRSWNTIVRIAGILGGFYSPLLLAHLEELWKTLAAIQRSSGAGAPASRSSSLFMDGPAFATLAITAGSTAWT
jgi:uncharacterized protein (DUF1697 family)